jgi:hypothetical protein
MLDLYISERVKELTGGKQTLNQRQAKQNKNSKPSRAKEQGN